MMLDDKQGRGRAGAVLDFYLFYSPFFLDLFHAFFMLHVWWFCSLRLYLCFGWNFSLGFFFATPCPSLIVLSQVLQLSFLKSHRLSYVVQNKSINRFAILLLLLDLPPFRVFFLVNSGVHAVGMLF